MPSYPGDLKKLLYLTAAPMAGVSTPVFRRLCVSMGATLAFTEMISARALRLGNRKTYELMSMGPDERSVGAQVFGTDPEDMALAAKLVEEAGFLLVDINMGCPVPKVTSTGAGAALMKDPPLAAEIVSAMVKGAGIPVTAKIRSGWSRADINAVALARTLEQAGLAALTVHPRTRDQGYGGKADWRIIEEISRCLSIPVIGNGDVVDGSSAVRLFSTTGCSGIMIGRAALGRPWIFREVLAALDGRSSPPPPGGEERFDVFLTHFEGLLAEQGWQRGFSKMKKIGSWYIRGVRGAPAARKALHLSKTPEALMAVMKEALLETRRGGKK